LKQSIKRACGPVCAWLLWLCALGAAGLPAHAQEAGKKVFEECSACHSPDPGVNGVGPTLFGIVGTRAGEVEGFRFSGPMKRSGVVWTPDMLDKYIADPQAVVPGTRMPYSGLADAALRSELVKYLASLKH
jgi:cytochrome c